MRHGACLTFHLNHVRGMNTTSTSLSFHAANATMQQLARDAFSGRALLDPNRWSRCLARLRFTHNAWENVGDCAASAVEIGATSCIRGLTGQSVPESTCRSNPTFLWFWGLWRLCPRARRSEVQATCLPCRLMRRLISKAVD